MTGIVVRTSDKDWAKALAQVYKQQVPATLVDDAGLGVNPMNQTLLAMGRKANLTGPEWFAVFIGLGISAVGAGLLVAAVLDPEPYSKIAFTIASGGVMVLGGGFSAMRVITGHRPPKVTMKANGEFILEFP